MIKDVFELRKNSWYMKLMNFIWGYTEKDFPNMCPFFWLSVLNVIIAMIMAVPYLLWKITSKPVGYLIELSFSYKRTTKIKVEKYCEDRYQNWYENYVKKLEEGDDKYFHNLVHNSSIQRRFERKDYVKSCTEYSHDFVILDEKLDMEYQKGLPEGVELIKLATELSQNEALLSDILAEYDLFNRNQPRAKAKMIKEVLGRDDAGQALLENIVSAASGVKLLA